MGYGEWRGERAVDACVWTQWDDFVMRTLAVYVCVSVCGFVAVSARDEVAGYVNTCRVSVGYGYGVGGVCDVCG